MILLIFSNRWISRCVACVACEITKNVARSNKTTSSALHIEQNSFNWDSKSSMFGIKEYTIDDHARYNVSSQMDVAKQDVFKFPVRDKIISLRFSKTYRSSNQDCPFYMECIPLFVVLRELNQFYEWGQIFEPFVNFEK